MDAEHSIPNPYCRGMQEHPSAASERAKLPQGASGLAESLDPLSLHLSLGLAYTVGSAIGSRPPSTEACLTAFLVPNSVGLTAGSKAWSKHAHRSLPPQIAPDSNDTASPSKSKSSSINQGWWGTPSGSVAVINERALALFWKVMNAATWRNLHWLPHQILVYEVRIAEGYGMRWSQDRSGAQNDREDSGSEWVFRGFVEPMMENGHEVGWRH